MKIFNYFKNKYTKSLSKKFALFICFILSSPFAFAGLKDSVNTQLTNAATTILDILKTASLSIGAVYSISMLFLYVFKPEAFKENSKIIILSLIGVWVLYGLTSLGLNAIRPD